MKNKRDDNRKLSQFSFFSKNKRDDNRKLPQFSFFSKNKKGEILEENIIFIALNVLFLIILYVFVSMQGSGAILLEQSYAKNIALLISSAKPSSEITLDMEDAFAMAYRNKVKREDIVQITGNFVQVKLSSDGGYKYSFFNNVEVTAYPEEVPSTKYIIKINKYVQ